MKKWIEIKKLLTHFIFWFLSEEEVRRKRYEWIRLKNWIKIIRLFRVVSFFSNLGQLELFFRRDFRISFREDPALNHLICSAFSEWVAKISSEPPSS